MFDVETPCFEVETPCFEVELNGLWLKFVQSAHPVGSSQN